MKSYLSLVTISGKVRKRQNRMTIFCIIISVLLVTAIFSVADMFIRNQSEGLKQKHGNWHIQLENISQDTAEEISQRPDVAAVGWSEIFNADAEQPYYIGEKKVALYGTDSIYLAELVNALEEGSLPQSDNDIMLSSNAKLALDVKIGDSVTVKTPSGNTDFTVCGFGSDDAEYYQDQTYLVAAYMTRDAYISIMEQSETENLPDLKEFTVLSEQELDRIESLVQNLLKITRLDAGTIILERNFENVSDIMHDIEQHFAYRAKQEEKELILSGDDDIMLFCDREWMMEAVSNLVKNAFDHTDAGKRICVEWKQMSDMLQIVVKDNGYGIHAEDIYHIFKRFYRSRFSKDTPGLGLGLPLSKTIVELHGGNIKVDSVLGKGSAFIINILETTKL